MKRFPRSFDYKGYSIKKTSFNWHVTGEGLDEIVESYQDAKDLIDKTIIESKHETSKKINTLDNDLEEMLS